MSLLTVAIVSPAMHCLSLRSISHDRVESGLGIALQIEGGYFVRVIELFPELVIFSLAFVTCDFVK